MSKGTQTPHSQEQLQLIETIYWLTGQEYTGKTMSDAARFILKHIDNMQAVRKIQNITSYLQCVFHEAHDPFWMSQFDKGEIHIAKNV